MERKDNLKDLYIGIGSNIGNPIENINVALNFLSKSDFFYNKRLSGLYESPPMGPSNQNNYINAAIMFKCSESPEDILRLLKDIESSMGREKVKLSGQKELLI